MGSQVKQKIARNVKFYDAVQSKVNLGNFNDFFGRINLLNLKADKIVWRIPLPIPGNNSFDSESLYNSAKELFDNKTVKNIFLKNLLDKNEIHVELDKKRFVKDVLDSDPKELNIKSSPKRIIIEFSSPNIAKPFHVGHLRSTIIGNSLANIKKKFGHNIIKMNYVGDWGTQFGMIQLGMNIENYSEEDLKKDPFRILLKAYIKGNAEAEKNRELYEQAKKIFLDLESGKDEIIQLWNKYRSWTKEELDLIYKRLGVSFDEYSWESDFGRNKVKNVLKMLEEKGILSEDDIGRKVALVNDKKIPLLKSDGTTLYLLRDLQAIMDRRSKHSFDEMYYIVENGQTEHFQSLLSLWSLLKIDEGVKLEHVKFGRVHGMSTRKGRMVLLSDVIDEARDIIYEYQTKSKNTKVALSNQEVADILGVSTIVIYDLKQSRLKDYEFSWEGAVRINGNTGAHLQYCHCRLSNLEINCGFSAASDCDPEALLEPAAVNLISALARYEQTLWLSNENLEPCILVSYLFNLVKAVNIAYKSLPVKGGDSHVSSQRLLLFKKSREVLGEGLTLLGLKPLSQM